MERPSDERNEESRLPDRKCEKKRTFVGQKKGRHSKKAKSAPYIILCLSLSWLRKKPESLTGAHGKQNTTTRTQERCLLTWHIQPKEERVRQGVEAARRAWRQIRRRPSSLPEHREGAAVDHPPIYSTAFFHMRFQSRPSHSRPQAESCLQGKTKDGIPRGVKGG